LSAILFCAAQLTKYKKNWCELMKKKFERFCSPYVWPIVFIFIFEIKPAIAETKILTNIVANNQQLDRPQKDLYSTSARDLLAQDNLSANLVRVTGIDLKQTDRGLELILETATGQRLQPSIQSQGNTVTIDIADAVLALGDRQDFRASNPVAGISAITAQTLNATNIRVTIAGEKNVPTAEVIPSQNNLVLSLNPQTTAQNPETDKEIEIEVTGIREGDEDDYLIPKASTGLRTDAPILDTPQAIQVIPEKVIEDQQVIRLDEALRNTSGVTFGGTNLGRRLEFSIRGFDEAPILRDGFRQFGADVIAETANLDRIEVLKGPASVLYGEIEPGGLINLVTKKPSAKPFFDIETQFGNRGLVRPQIDFSAPLTEDGDLLYRLNALYQGGDPIEDVDTDIERYYIAPVVTWKIGKQTDLTFNLEYLDEKRSPTFGLPAIGNEIADVPFDRITNEPDDISEEKFLSFGYDFEHRFDKNWKLRNAFRYTKQNSLLEVAYPFEIDEETATVTRFWAAQPQNSKSISLQTNAVGKVATGSIEHELLFGVDLNSSEDNFNDRIRLDTSNPLELNIFDPVYKTAARPDFSQLPLISDRETETSRLGVFLQDRISFSDNLFLLAGLRYETVEQTVTNNPTEEDPTFLETTQDNDDLTPRVGIVYKPADPISLYASYSQSFAPNPETTAEGESLDPEEGEGFEVGVKTELLKRKLFTTLAYFNITKQNVASEDPNDPFSFVATGEQQSQGVELDVTGEILPGWNVIASYAYIDAEVKEDNVIEIGNRLPNAPENSASLWTTYEIPKGNLKGLGFGVGFNFVGERQGDLDNSFQLDSFFLTNAAVFYQRDNWRAALNFKNLFDVDYIAGGSIGRERGNDPGEPFTVIGSLSVKF
jgi:iron complex outermembrane recepter protein